MSAESVAVWTWCVYIDGYPWTDGGTALKAWRTKAAAEADARREWGDDVDVTPIRIALIDGCQSSPEEGTGGKGRAINTAPSPERVTYQPSSGGNHSDGSES